MEKSGKGPSTDGLHPAERLPQDAGMNIRFSVEGRLSLIVITAVCFGIAVVYLCSLWIAEPLIAYVAGLFLSIPPAIWLVRVLSRNLVERIEGLHAGMLNLIDNDFSVSLVNTTNDELGRVIGLYNQVAGRLRDERRYLYQRELLLDTVIQNSSICLVLTDQTGRVIYANHDAKNMFNKGKHIQGMPLDEVLKGGTQALRDVIHRGQGGLFSIGGQGEEDSYHISLGRFQLNAQRHNLYLIKRMTRELNRREVAVWKKVIRVISHELNNSLAPISSMAHSGRLMIEKGKVDALPAVFETIDERADHLRRFIEGYAALAKLPAPQKTRIDWRRFIEKLKIGCRFDISGELPADPGFFDQAQMEQVLVNLLKNAVESGSDTGDITLKVSQTNARSTIEIADRGGGMSPQVMENALLPFYTTKATGSGVGLPLCREIVEAHEGEIFLFNRRNGGVRVKVVLPLETVSPGH